MNECTDTTETFSCRRNEQDVNAGKQEQKELLGLTGKLYFLGYGCLLFAAFAAGYQQQKIPLSKVSALKGANATLHELKNYNCGARGRLGNDQPICGRQH